jgi:hypothetical protein
VIWRWIFAISALTSPPLLALPVAPMAFSILILLCLLKEGYRQFEREM